MDECKRAINRIVEKLLNDWVSFQIALEHGMGGHTGKQKEAEMSAELANYLISHEKVDASDIEGYIEEILDEDFDTIIDDGTVPQLAQLMVKLAELCKNGMIEYALNQLPEHKPALPDARPEPSQTVDDENMVDVSEVDDVADQVAGMSSASTARRRANEPDEDGWVTVGKTNK